MSVGHNLRPLRAGTLMAELLDLARLVRSLVPDRRDSERFHILKNEAAARLAALARRIEKEVA